MKKVFGDVLELIGNTPMIKINNIVKKPGVEVFAKLEGQNPGGSIKDRIALNMILQAEKNGLLNNNKIILEPTSGNTGIGLAIISIIRGYAC